MKRKNLLVFDIDGTLIDRSKNTIEASALEAIKQAQKQNYPVVIATGRTLFFIVNQIKKELKPDYYITTNGALIFDKNQKCIHKQAFDKEDLYSLIEYAKINDYPLGVKYQDVIATYLQHDNYIRRYIGAHSDKSSYIIDDVDMSYFKQHPAYGIYMYAPYQAIEQLSNTFPHLGYAQAEDEAIEIFPRGADKSLALNALTKITDFKFEDMIAFGDGHNDIQMLNQVGVGVAMGNADKLVQDAADLVTDKILDDGIDKALRKLNII